MPQFAAYLGLTIYQLWVVGIAIVGTGISISDSRRSARRMEEQMRRNSEAEQAAAEKLARQQADAYGGGVGSVGRDETKTMLKSSKAPRNVIFGVDRVSGPMVCFFSSQAGGSLFHQFGVVLAAHECDAIEAVYFNEDELTLNSGGGVIAPAKYTQAGRPLFYIEKHLGQPGQTASTILMGGATSAGVPASWDSSRKGTGICYVAINMEADWDALHTVGIPNVSARIRGVKAYDPRTSTTVYTQNPALLARWWLVDSGYCPTTLDAEIDEDELIASANVCDELVEFSAGNFAARYTANGYINSNANPLENLNKILGAMDGSALWLSGKWQLLAGYYRTPQLHIDESKLGGGGITISPYTPTANLFNAISGQFKGPATSYQASGYGIIAPAEYLAEDGGQVYEKKDDFDLVNEATRCQMIAWQRLSRARQQLAINIDCNLKAYDTSPLQNVTLSLAEFGYDAKVFEVRKRTFAGTHIEYSLQETGPAVWEWDYTLMDAVVDIPNVNVPVTLRVDQLMGVTITSGTESLLINNDGTITSRIKVTWDEVQSTFVRRGGYIEWQYRTADVGSGAGAWLNAPRISGTQTVAYMDPVVDGVLYELRGRCVSQLGARGLSTGNLSHTVIGKTEPPSNVPLLTIDGISLAWTEVTDVDLAGYVLRFNYGNNNAWGTATPINNGFITQSPYDWTMRPSGAVTVLVKAIDTTGNLSYLPTALYTDLGDAPISNVVQEFPFHPAFDGTLTDCAVSVGVLQADSSTSFYPADNQPFYPLDAFPFYPTSTFAAMTYVTEWVYVNATLAGSQATLALDYTGEGLLIEYRTGSPEPMFGGDETAAFYEPDADPFYGEQLETDWQLWPGQVTSKDDIYQFRITIGSGTVRGTITSMALVIDAPDIEETVNDLDIDAGGTVIPLTKPFTVVKGIQATLQAGVSDAVNVIIDKTNNLAPVIKAVDTSLTSIAGASADITVKGY